METIVTKSYQGAQTRLLLPKIKDVAGVIGDNNSTRLVFKLPKIYENWDKFIEFDCYVIREDMEIKPVYALDENNSFLIPYEITESNVGKEVDYNLKFVTNDGEIVEKSEIGTLYFRDSSNGEFTEVEPQVDILTYLYDNAFCNVAYKDGSIEGDQSLPALTFTPMNPNAQTEEITLNVPYLQNGVIPNRFIDKEIVIEVFKITTPDALTSLDAQVPDMALITDPNSLYYNNLYILVNNDPTDADNWYLAHTDNPVFNNIKVNGNADITTLTTESLTINDDNLKSKILITDANGTITTDSSLELSEIHALDGITGNIQNQINTLDIKIDTEIQDRIDDVGAEESRATAAETQLNTAITNESNRATQAESTLQSNIDGVSNALAQEILDRQSADATLSDTKRDKIATQHSDYPMAYTQSVNGEESQHKIIDSFTDAQQQQTISIGGSLVARQNDGTIVSSTPQNDYEVTTKAYVDGVISSEASARSSADDNLSNRITGETTARTNADATLTSNLASEVANRTSEITRVEGLITAETSARETADETLQSNINTEETRAKGVESGLRTDLTAETTARTTADTTLTNNLASEVNTRTSEITRVEGLISSETTARESADTILQNNINGVSSNLAQEVTRATGVEAGLNTRISNIEGVIPSGTNTDNKLTNKSYVDNADNGLQSSITTLQNNKVDKTFNTSVFTGTSIPSANITASGVSLLFNTKNTNNNAESTVTLPLPVATDEKAGIATASQIAQIEQNRADINTLMGKSTRYAVDVDLSEKTEQQIQSALTTAWRSASGQSTGDPAQYTTLVNLWNNHEYTWLTIVTDPTTNPPTTTSQWEDRGISTVSIATDTSVGVVLSTPQITGNEGNIYVDSNGSMQVIGWDPAMGKLANAISDIGSLESSKVDKTTTVNNHPLSSNITLSKSDIDLGNVNNTSDIDKPISTATQNALDLKIDSVNQTGSGYVSSVSVNSTDKTQLDVTRTALPTIGNATLTIQKNGTAIDTFTANATSNKTINIQVVDNVQSDWNSTSGLSAILHKPTLAAVATSGSYNDLSNKPTIPTIPDITVATSGSGNAITSVSVDTNNKHKLNFTKGTTFLTSQDISGKANVDLKNLSIGDGTAVANGQTIVWDTSNNRWKYGEAGAVDDVKVNGATVVSNKVANVTVPTKVSQLTNDTGFITGLGFDELSAHPDTLSGYGITDAVSNVSYNSTSKKIQKTINGSTSDVVTLATVATSGSYNDLSNKPTIPTVNNGTLTIKQNGTSKATFTANQSGNSTAELTDTTYSAGPGLTLDNNTTTFKETFPVYYTRPNETTSTATLTATISNFPSAYTDGIMIALRMPFANVASTTLNVNGLGEKPIYYANNTTTADRWGKAGIIAFLVYETTTVSTGCWKAVYSYDSNSDTKVRQNIPTNSTILSTNRPLLMSYLATTDTGTGNKDGVAYRSTGMYANISTNTITATKFVGALEGNVTGDCTGTAGGVAWANVSGKPSFATVATSGSYNDLSNKPTIPTVYDKTLTLKSGSTNVAQFTANSNSDVTVLIEGSGGTTVTPDASNKKFTISSANLAAVATSGSYNDLSNKPTIPTVNNGTLNIQGDANTVGSFTANATGTTNINFASGTKVSISRDTTNKKLTINHTNTTRTDTTSTASPAHGGTFTAVDGVTTDATGHITAVNVKTVTLPASGNTDTKVRQTTLNGSDNVNRALILAYNVNTTTGNTDNITYRSTKIYANDSTGTVTAPHFHNSTTNLSLDFSSSQIYIEEVD